MMILIFIRLLIILFVFLKIVYSFAHIHDCVVQRVPLNIDIECRESIHVYARIYDIDLIFLKSKYLFSVKKIVLHYFKNIDMKVYSCDWKT